MLERFREERSHLFQRVASFLHLFLKALGDAGLEVFSSLSESGFIPTEVSKKVNDVANKAVLISFREWLHSYQ